MKRYSQHKCFTDFLRLRADAALASQSLAAGYRISTRAPLDGLGAAGRGLAGIRRRHAGVDLPVVLDKWANAWQQTWWVALLGLLLGAMEDLCVCVVMLMVLWTTTSHSSPRRSGTNLCC
ncbi:hypothetical protein GQ600_5184 [Phytophthora cactorum]|nr:hypothetical protein GQ600_5184 [Phytophthora cactorum]